MPRTQYSDFSLSFEQHPDTGALGKLYDGNAINQSIRNLLLTRHYERPFHSEIGSQLTDLLFENATPFTAIRMRKVIENTLENQEPRINLVRIDVLDDSTNNAYEINIYYTIVNSSEVQSTSLYLERTR